LQYTLSAQLGTFQLEREFLVASAPLPSDIIPCIAQPTTHELKTFGLLNKGFLSVGASVANSRVGRGQTLRVSVASRNDALVDIDRVRVKVVELIEYKAFGGEHHHTIKNELSKLKDIETNLPGLIKTKADGDHVRRSIRQGFRQNIETTYQAIYEDLLSGENQVDVVIPKYARDSYNGNLITISHYLKVTFFTKALVENPSTKIPLVIGSPSRETEQQSGPLPRQRNEPIATVIFDDDDDASVTESTIEVGARAESFPMANAVLLDQHRTTTPVLPQPSAPDDTIVLGAETVFPCDDSEGGFYDALEVILPPPGLTPSAPSESVLMERDYGRNGPDIDDQSAEPLPSIPQHSDYPQQRRPSPPNAYSYSPFNLYNQPARQQHHHQQQQRMRVDSYEYDSTIGASCDTTADSSHRPQLGRDPPPPGHGRQQRHSDSQWLLERLLQELIGSIHDYEVVAVKVRETEYQDMFATLTPAEYASIVGHVSMSHQVQVALLLAKQLAKDSSFTCEHCAASLRKTSEYFRSNMVETLVPFCNDLSTNRKLIQGSLSEWEQIITTRIFEDAERR
jgi:hypothetical protein